MTDEPSLTKLNLLPGLKFILLFALIITGFALGLQYLNHSRSQTITQKYYQETLSYIQSNRPGLQLIFTQLFDQAHSCYQKGYTVRDECYLPIGQQINSAISQDLTDYSSTYFIRRLDEYNYELMLLSGDYQTETTKYQNDTAKNQHLQELFNQQTDQIIWDDYFYQFGKGKEIIVPVDIQGQRIGAIVRRVIE